MFNFGQIVQTSGIANERENDPVFADNVRRAFYRYVKKDWGDLTQGDKDANDQALENGDERILASYWILNSESEKKKIYIITEWDRSVTTILFADEY